MASCGSCQCHAWKITIRICELFSSLFCCCCFPNLPWFLHVLFFPCCVFLYVHLWALGHIGFSFLGGSFCNMYIWEQVSSFQRSFKIFRNLLYQGFKNKVHKRFYSFFCFWFGMMKLRFFLPPLFENFLG